MAVPSQFDDVWPIRRTGSETNERVQINKALERIFNTLDTITTNNNNNIVNVTVQINDIIERLSELETKQIELEERVVALETA